MDDNTAIYDYTTGGTRSTFSTMVGQTALEMAFNPSGTLYVANRDSNDILAYSPSGVESAFASVSSPYGLAVNSAGDVFTGADFGSEILEYTPDGQASVFATGTSVTELVIGPNGNLYENDNNGDINEFTPGGTKTVFASGLNGGYGNSSIYGLTFDTAGNLYASNWQGQILEFSPSGAESTFATYSPSSDLITGLAYDEATGNIYAVEVANGVSACCNQFVSEFSPAGVRSIFATGLYNPYAIADLQSGFTSTPEPASRSMMLGGAVLLAVRAFRRRRPSHQV